MRTVISDMAKAQAVKLRVSAMILPTVISLSITASSAARLNQIDRPLLSLVCSSLIICDKYAEKIKIAYKLAVQGPMSRMFRMAYLQLMSDISI